MANEKLARRYAVAVFALAREANAVDRVGNDLATMAAALDSDAMAKEFFVAPIVDRRQKERVLAETFGSRAHEVAVHTLLLLVRKRRETLLPALLSEYRKLQRAARGENPLTVTSANELPVAELRALVERLERLYAKKFDVTHVVDPETIGGVMILMGDRRIDGTVAGRLEALSRTLFAPS
ncbi:MAG: ATP synthase F1 subunit delta [Candidatus Eremiobacteraeota bacterium]|nr:ATP synthase F1 subunit delta [Candidatus Eremiobacteraeota bacterium]MBV8373815.1 ATP synthase F1 subunit delta [Candidatus Eremiobacteraeota bacterium]